MLSAAVFRAGEWVSKYLIGDLIGNDPRDKSLSFFASDRFIGNEVEVTTVQLKELVPVDAILVKVGDRIEFTDKDLRVEYRSGYRAVGYSSRVLKVRRRRGKVRLFTEKGWLVPMNSNHKVFCEIEIGGAIATAQVNGIQYFWRTQS